MPQKFQISNSSVTFPPNLLFIGLSSSIKDGKKEIFQGKLKRQSFPQFQE